ETVEEVAELHAVGARRKEIELGCYVSPALPAVVAGDAARLRPLLSSLAGAGVKSTEPRAVVLRAARAAERGRCVLSCFGRAEPGAVRVLCVDDNASSRLILERLLQGWGLDVHAVASGPEGLARLRAAHAERRPYRVAVADLVMPDMDGIELTRRIKADPAFAGVAVILLTAFGMREDAERAREAGALRCLTKPARASLV